MLVNQRSGKKWRGCYWVPGGLHSRPSRVGRGDPAELRASPLPCLSSSSSTRWKFRAPKRTPSEPPARGQHLRGCGYQRAPPEHHRDSLEHPALLRPRRDPPTQASKIRADGGGAPDTRAWETGSKASARADFGAVRPMCGENGNPLAQYSVSLDYPWFMWHRGHRTSVREAGWEMPFWLRPKAWRTH